MNVAAAIPNGLLWHYTGFQAFKDIVETSTMWASNLGYLNDTQEFRHSISVIRRVFDDGGFPDIGLEIDPTGITTLLSQMMTIWQQNGIFVTCLSRQPDDLSQWRAYAHNIPGFAIGFNRDLLNKRLIGLGHTLVDVEYDLVTQKKEIRTELMKAFDAMRADQNFATMDQGRRVASFYATYLSRVGLGPDLTNMAIRNKDPKFSAESEVRMVARGVAYEKWLFRQSRSLIVPYFKWTLRDGSSADSYLNMIESVIVGPGPHTKEVLQVAQRMCAQNRVTATVVPSEVPYRNW